MTGGPLAELNAAYRALERAQKGLEKLNFRKKQNWKPELITSGILC